MDLKDVAQRLIPTKGDTPRTYARKYRYPKLGFGRIFDRLADKLVIDGVELLLSHSVTGLKMEGKNVKAIRCANLEIPIDHVISTLPLPMVAEFLDIPHQLEYRSLRFFNMPMATENISDNTWQYLSDPGILATRLQEPRRRSPYMAPEGHTSLMLEIPCFEDDKTWSMTNEELLPRVLTDLQSLGVDTNKSTGEYFSSHTAHAYPMMRIGYQQERQNVIQQLNQISNLIMTGRQGTFRYIFTDTAMEMGQLAARSLIERQDRREEIFDFCNEPTVIETQSVA